MFFVSVLQRFQPHFIMHSYYVGSVVHHFNCVFCLGGRGSRFVVLSCLLLFFFVIVVLGLFYDYCCFVLQ